ncbi:MAG: PDZ domain-containing protein [Planctomycetes bacterium]|nr:PDZ domain-containing protein [Planctomycetota bacterium]
MIYSQSGSSAGIGFAVPVDTINRIVPQLISYGKVIRPGLGVNIAGDEVAERLGLDGVLILGVGDGSAAERAGLQPTMETRDGRIVLGDIIVRVGDIPTPDRNALLNALEKYEIGETVDVTVERRGRTKTVSVTLQAIE